MLLYENGHVTMVWKVTPLAVFGVTWPWLEDQTSPFSEEQKRGICRFTLKNEKVKK